MRPIVIGCNHKTAPVEVREKLAFDPETARQVMNRLRHDFSGCESVILCTCNRSEVYVARTTHGHPRRDDLVSFLGEFCPDAGERLSEYLYIHDGRGAIEHLFRVVCSLDSMVVGETQIVSQVKQAVAEAQACGACGKTLTTLFQWALHVAKEVHTETQISSGQVSVGSVAVQFARQIFAQFGDKTVLMIGAGAMGKLTLRHVLEMRPNRVIVANRTASRAEQLAGLFGAEAAGLDRLEDTLTGCDIVITSTGAAAPIVGVPLIESVQSRRGYRPLIIIDIAMPRDVEPAVGQVDNVYLYNIDDLQSVIDAGMEDRQAQVAACSEIVTQHVDEFIRWRDARSIGPLVNALRRRLTEITSAEAGWARPKLTGNPHRDAEIIDQLMHRVVGKILHGPTRSLGAKVKEGHIEVYAETLRRMFDLPEEQEPDESRPEEPTGTPTT
jgi:glutamyl-tRNA reductase